MANRITMSICGEDYTLVADESAAYMEKVGALVDEKMTQLQEGAHVSRIDAAVLTAVKLTSPPFSSVTRRSVRPGTLPAAATTASRLPCAVAVIVPLAVSWAASSSGVLVRLSSCVLRLPTPCSAAMEPPSARTRSCTSL